jgi:phage terminase large subunit
VGALGGRGAGVDQRPRLMAKPQQVRIGVPHLRTLFTPARHKALFGGSGSGKSYAAATYLTITAARANKRIICARQFQNSIRDSSKELVEKRIQALGLERQFDVIEREIIHKQTRAQFIFIGLDRNVDSIRSLEGADVVWVEEARTISSKSMEILLPTIRKQGSEIIWCWNPEQPTDPVDAYFRSGNPPPRSIVTKVTYEDNPYFFKTEMLHEMEVLRKGNPDRYKFIWLGQYDNKYESKVFPNTRTGRLDIPANCPPRFGLDFGFGADPSAMIKLYVLERSRQIYICAEAFGRPTLDQLPAFIRSVCPRDGDLITADSSQPGTIEFLVSRRLNIVGARKGSGSVQSGINFLQGYEIVIDPNCESMRDEARYYSWNVDRLTNKVLPGNPVDAFNHGWDSVRMAVEDLTFGADALDDDEHGGVIELKMWR